MSKLGFVAAWGAAVLFAAAPLGAQTRPHVVVTVDSAGGVVVTPSTYAMGPGQASLTISLATRGYSISGITFSTGGDLFSCTVQGGGNVMLCAVGRREPGARAEYTLTLSSDGSGGSGAKITSTASIFIQSE